MQTLRNFWFYCAQCGRRASILRKAKHEREREGVGDERLQKKTNSFFKNPQPVNFDELHTLFIDGLKPCVDAYCLRFMFKDYGRVMDAFIPLKKRTKTESRFGFIRFRREIEALDAMKALDGAKRFGSIISVTRARYRRTGARREEKREDVQGTRTYTRETIGGVSYCEAVKGTNVRVMKEVSLSDKTEKETEVEETSEGGVAERRRSIHVKGMEKDWMKLCLVAKMQNAAMCKTFEDICQSEGVNSFEVKLLGGAYILLKFSDRDELRAMEEDGYSWLLNWSEEVFPWNANFKCNFRFTWLSCTGLPLHAWNTETYHKISEIWGEFILVDEDTYAERNYNRARIMISTNEPKIINECIELKINNNRCHEVMVMEETQTKIGMYQVRSINKDSVESSEEDEDTDEDAHESCYESNEKEAMNSDMENRVKESCEVEEDNEEYVQESCFESSEKVTMNSEKTNREREEDMYGDDGLLRRNHEHQNVISVTKCKENLVTKERIIGDSEVVLEDDQNGELNTAYMELMKLRMATQEMNTLERDRRGIEIVQEEDQVCKMTETNLELPKQNRTNEVNADLIHNNHQSISIAMYAGIAGENGKKRQDMDGKGEIMETKGTNQFLLFTAETKSSADRNELRQSQELRDKEMENNVDYTKGGRKEKLGNVSVSRDEQNWEITSSGKEEVSNTTGYQNIRKKNKKMRKMKLTNELHGFGGVLLRKNKVTKKRKKKMVHISGVDAQQVFLVSESTGSDSVSSSNIRNRNAVIEEEARLTIEIGKTCGMNVIGNEEELVQKLIEMEVSDLAAQGCEENGLQ